MQTWTVRVVGVIKLTHRPFIELDLRYYFMTPLTVHWKLRVYNCLVKTQIVIVSF